MNNKKIRKKQKRYKMEKLNIYILDMVVEEYMKRIKEMDINKIVKIYRKTGGKCKEIKEEMIRRSSYINYEIYSSMEYIKWLLEEQEIIKIDKCMYFIEGVQSGMKNIEQIKYIWQYVSADEVGMKEFIYKLAENMYFEELYILAYLEAWDIDEILKILVMWNGFADCYGYMDVEYRIKIFEDFHHSMSRNEYNKIVEPEYEE
jgi:hypothetical protein